MPKKNPRVIINRVISSAERHAYTPAYELLPKWKPGEDRPRDVLPEGTVLEIVSIPPKRKS